MTPSRFLHEIYGPGLAYSGYAPAGANRWLPSDRTLLLAITGNQLAAAGEMPILCAAGTATAAGLDLLGEAGLGRPAHLHLFRDEVEYGARLAELTGAGQRIVVQHRHPAHLLPAESCWIAPDLVSWLNDKGNLAELVPAPFLPRRRVVAPGQLSRPLPGLSFPCLIKAATRQSTGGGSLDLYRCVDADDLATACVRLQGSERLVVEEWLPASRFLCLNHAVDPYGKVSDLGSTEIINGPGGAYLGNWLGDACAAPAAAIELGRAIAGQGARAGYIGCLCVDVAELPDGRVLAVDLNFRACGSTVPLLLYGAVRQATGAPMAKFRSWSGRGDFSTLIAGARAAMRAGFLVPVGSFDPAAHGEPAPARLSALLVGDDREEIAARERELADLGWT